MSSRKNLKYKSISPRWIGRSPLSPIPDSPGHMSFADAQILENRISMLPEDIKSIIHSNIREIKNRPMPCDRRVFDKQSEREAKMDAIEDLLDDAAQPYVNTLYDMMQETSQFNNINRNEFIHIVDILFTRPDICRLHKILRKERW